MVGGKANGKSTFLDLIKAILGKENYSALDLKELGDRFSTSMMFGKLANIGDDIADDFMQGSQVSIFKKIVTGNTIKAECKGQDPFEFEPYVKLLFSANDIPRMKDRTGAVLSRLKIIPFNAVFQEGQANYVPFIKYKLIEDQTAMEYLIALGVSALRGILNRQGFTHSEKVDEQIREFEEENNSIAAFVKEYGSDVVVNEATTDIYRMYLVFCQESSMNPMQRVTFTKEIKKFLNLDISVKKIRGKATRVFVRKGYEK